MLRSDDAYARDRASTELVRRGEHFDLVTDQTSAHDPLNGYIPLGLTLEQKGEWTRVTNVDSKKDAALAGVRSAHRTLVPLIANSPWSQALGPAKGAPRTKEAVLIAATVLQPSLIQPPTKFSAPTKLPGRVPAWTMQRSPISA